MSTTTEIGKRLRMIRLEHDERLMDMASKLKVSSSFLSAIEKGHKSPPPAFEDIVSKVYRLTLETVQELQRAADRSRRAFTLKPKSELERDTVGLLARRMDALSDDELKSIQRILQKR